MLKILKNKCGKSPHDNPMEKEADLHAVNKTSRKDLMKGVNEYSKKISKERQKQTNKALDEYGVTGKDKEKQLKKAKTSLNKELSEDSRNRSRVLKDKKLLEKSKKVYNYISAIYNTNPILQDNVNYMDYLESFSKINTRTILSLRMYDILELFKIHNINYENVNEEKKLINDLTEENFGLNTL